MKSIAKKSLVGILLASTVIIVGITLLIMLNRAPASVEPSSDSSYFPYFIFFPSWVAIFIPIIAQKRREERLKREEYDFDDC
jgi:hypothetical protein